MGTANDQCPFQIAWKNTSRLIVLNLTRNEEREVRTTQQLSITLPNAMADLVRSKVSTGEYASESEVIREGIRRLMARDKAIESWLSQSIGPRFDKTIQEPDALLSITEARHALNTK